MKVIRMFENNELYLVSEIENLQYCECGDHYGSKIGCYTAGCWSIENSYMLNDIKKEIAEEEGLDAVEDVTEEQLAEWEISNAEHSEIEGIEYIENGNFKTIFKDHDFEVEENNDLEEKIISEFKEIETPSSDEFNYGRCIIETKSFFFEFTQFEGFELCKVEGK